MELGVGGRGGVGSKDARVVANNKASKPKTWKGQPSLAVNLHVRRFKNGNTGITLKKQLKLGME